MFLLYIFVVGSLYISRLEMEMSKDHNSIYYNTVYYSVAFTYLNP